jgi:superfamily II DNA or RNA helicase
MIINSKYGFVYIRNHYSYDDFKLNKIGITTNLINRNYTYITGEVKRGNYICIYEIPNDILNKIDVHIKYYFSEYRIKYCGGIEFFTNEIINKLEEFFIKFNYQYRKFQYDEIENIEKNTDKLLKKKYTKYCNEIKKYNFIEKYNFIINKTIKPHYYQQEVLDNIEKYYNNNSIGKISWACGLGKALLSIFIIKKLNFKLVVIGVPSIHLQKQFKKEILKIFDNKKNIIYIGGNENNVKETSEIENFIHKKSNDCKFIITTYASCNLISDKYVFDIKIGDEAHHLVGTKNEKTKHSFHNIKSNKTLFMTATEKIINNRIDNNLYSMDNINIFGEYIDIKSINWAIENKKITDYNLVILKNSENEINNIINSLNLNSMIKHKDMFLAAFIALKSIERYDSLSHILIYTNTTNNSVLIKEYIDIILNLNIININKENYYNEALHSKSDKKLLDTKLSEGEITKFNKSKWGVISSVYIFGEGFDCPRLNGVIFSENMESEIRIVQAALRPNRLDKNNSNKIAYIMIPYIYNENLTIENNSFNKCKDIIAKIRNVDKNIEYKIKMISLTTDIENYNINENKNIKSNFAYFIENDLELKKIKLRLIYSKSLGSNYSEEQNEFNYMRQLNISLNIQNKEDYTKQYVKEFYSKNDVEYIQEIEEYFKKKCVWTNWYDFMGIDTSMFIQNKEDWKKFCKEKDINSLKKYIELCDIYKKLPKNPAEFYIGFNDIKSELEINERRRKI